MFFDDKRRAVTTMMARRSPKGDKISGPAPMKNELVMDEDRVPDGRHMAAQDILAALYEKSPEALMKSLDNFMAIRASAPASPDGPKEA